MINHVHEQGPTQAKVQCELEIAIRKKATILVQVDEQWMSEKEMKDDLSWSQRLASFSHGLGFCSFCAPLLWRVR